MYLATVTCNRDFQQMMLQAESIGRYLNPCKHVIIVNESVPDIEFWYRWLKPYYHNHELIIRPRIDYPYPSGSIGVRNVYGEIDAVSNGWRSQQLQKMLLAYEYEDDYLLLDSKNFFIRPTDITEWEESIGSGSFQQFAERDMFIGSYKKYAELFGYEIDHYIGPFTPFIVKREPLVSKCTLAELGYKLFYSEHYNQPASEGIFYSFFVDDIIKKRLGIPFAKSWTVWGPDYPNLAKNLFQISMDSCIKVAGLHREILSKMTNSELKIVDFWLNSDNHMGFTNKIYPMPRDSHI
jgi:hypothetical protein